jgi:hypothetical protein
MTKNQKTIIFAIVGVVVMLVIVVIVTGVWFVRSLVDNVNMDQTAATKTLEDVRARFAPATPALDLRPGGVTLVRHPPDTAPPGELKTLHILRWDIHQQRLSRLDVPFWLLRMKEMPIEVFYSDEASSGTGLRVRTPSTIRVSDLERFGSALLVDGDMPDGGHVLIWSE